MVKRKATTIERVYSNRLRNEIEAKYDRITEKSEIKALLNILLSCDNYLAGNKQYADEIVKNNVKAVQTIKDLVREEYDRRLRSWSFDLNPDDGDGD